MYRLSASLLFLLAGSFTLAQTSTANSFSVSPVPAGQTRIVPRAQSASLSCPVGFFARRQGGLQVFAASDAKKSGTAQGLHLVLDHLNQPSIQSIEVTVYGTSLKGRTLFVGQASNDTVSKTFELHRTTGSASLDDADVWMQNVGSVRWADLISVTYADGTTWHPVESLPCRAVPSNFVLVGNR
jgi:hypothetical protein